MKINKNTKEKNNINDLEFIRKSNDEVETIISFDNDRRICNVYTTRNATGRKLQKHLGRPYNIEFLLDKIYSIEWNIPFDDRVKIRKVLSINNFYIQQK